MASSTLGDLPSSLVLPGGFKNRGSDGSSSGQPPPDTAWRPSGPRAPAQEKVCVQQPVPAAGPLRPLPGQVLSWFCACRQGPTFGELSSGTPGPQPEPAGAVLLWKPRCPVDSTNPLGRNEAHTGVDSLEPRILKVPQGLPSLPAPGNCLEAQESRHGAPPGLQLLTMATGHCEQVGQEETGKVRLGEGEQSRRVGSGPRSSYSGSLVS